MAQEAAVDRAECKRLLAVEAVWNAAEAAEHAKKLASALRQALAWGDECAGLLARAYFPAYEQSSLTILDKRRDAALASPLRRKETTP